MIEREESVDDPAGLRLISAMQSDLLGLPGLRCFLAQKTADGLRIELGFAAEMPVEAAMRKTGVGHDFANRCLGEPLFVEHAPGALQNPLSRGILALGCI